MPRDTCQGSQPLRMATGGVPIVTAKVTIDVEVKPIRDGHIVAGAVGVEGAVAGSLRPGAVDEDGVVTVGEGRRDPGADLGDERGKAGIAAVVGVYRREG